MMKIKVSMLKLFTLLIISIAVESQDGPKAQTQQGIYIGRQGTVNGTNVNSWYGIPYAQQPIGTLRWKPPQPLPISNDTQTAFTPTVCPQGASFDPSLTESCLTLNVHAPDNATNLPVYVWIHGGGFTGGSGISCNATSFVGRSVNYSVPVVVVAINYRLGLLGFLADQALYDEKSGINNRSTTGNYGILDQIMALDWVKKNIRGFGGNPEQITVGGQSAGGISITILLTSPLVPNGTFQRVIIESGGLWPNSASTLVNSIRGTGDKVRASTNCTTLECLRNLTLEQIHAAQKMGPLPTIDNYVLDDIMENNYARGNFKKIPVLIGSTANETAGATCNMFNDSATIDQVQAYINRSYNATIIHNIADIYGPISTYNTPLAYLSTVSSDAWAHCGSRRIATKFSSYQVSSYLYTFNYRLPFFRPCFGASHSSELPMLYSPFYPHVSSVYTLTPEEQQLSTNMVRYWANFIHTSNPNFVGSLANWDAYSTAADNDLVLDIHPQMRNHYYNAPCSRLWDLYAVTNSTSAVSMYNHIDA